MVIQDNKIIDYKWLKNGLNMKNDSLAVKQNKDGSFTVEWDKQDENWKWLNDLTSKEIQVIIEQAIKYDHAERV